METRILYHDRDGVRRTSIVDDENPYVLRTYTEMDMDEILDGIKRDRELHATKSTNKLLARVPLTIAEQAHHEQWDDAKWKHWLNDPDNAAFRVWPGRV